MKINTPAGWTECTPTKINTPGGWQVVRSVKMSVDGVWKDVYPTEEPLLLTNILWRNTENSLEVEFTAVGGSGTFMWDPDGDGTNQEIGGYGTRVWLHTYKGTAPKTVTCLDMGEGGSDPLAQQGVKVTIQNVRPTL
jgi:hypothetical protein